MDHTFLLYGANGYTGELIARHAVQQGLKPILAGRNETAVAKIAEELNLDYAAFSLDDTATLDQHLEGVSTVMHAAGPFIHTARPMLEACLRTKTHYLDITGEIPVFEMAASLGKRAYDAGILLMPGTGFDVVPTDCMALFLKNKLPSATHLQLAFASKGSRFSRGTALTMAENLGGPSAVRINGKIIPVETGHKHLTVPFTQDKHWLSMTIPWGDVSTAYYTTGISNIETYTAVPPKTFRIIRLQKYFNWLLKSNMVRNFVKNRIKKDAPGPTEAQRKEGRSYVWGKVLDASGQSVEARIMVPEGYDLTMKSSVLIAQKVLAGTAPAGFQTPAKAFGQELIREVDPGASFEVLSD
jgi:short subunit dehydrogenase-like uncharacterized protein